MLLLEFDKAGAEWVVVAYLTGDQKMIDIAEGPVSPHVETGHLISRLPKEIIEKENQFCGHETDPDQLDMLRREHVPEMFEIEGAYLTRSMTIRQAGKKSNHGLNYRMKYKRFALENEVPEGEAKHLVDLYTKVAYPGLGNWWKAIEDQLRKDRTLINCFGRKRRFLDAWGVDLFEAATAYVPQSTIFDTNRIGMVYANNDDTPEFAPAELLAQTHDSATYQYPVGQDTEIDWMMMALFVQRMAHYHMNPTLHYNGRDFKIRTTVSAGLSWGHGMSEVEVPANDTIQTAENLRAVWEKARAGQEAA